MLVTWKENSLHSSAFFRRCSCVFVLFRLNNRLYHESILMAKTIWMISTHFKVYIYHRLPNYIWYILAFVSLRCPIWGKMKLNFLKILQFQTSQRCFHPEWLCSVPINGDTDVFKGAHSFETCRTCVIIGHLATSLFFLYPSSRTQWHRLVTAGVCRPSRAQLTLAWKWPKGESGGHWSTSGIAWCIPNETNMLELYSVSACLITEQSPFHSI